MKKEADVPAKGVSQIIAGGRSYGSNSDHYMNTKEVLWEGTTGEKWEMTMETTSALRGMEYKLRKINSINSGRK